MRRTIKLGIVTALILGTFVGCTGGTEKTYNVIATIKDKQYTPSSTYTVMVHMGKTAMPQTRRRPEKYEVYLTVDTMEYMLNDEDLYKMFDIEDEVKCRVTVKYNKNGEYKSSTLEKGWEIE